LGFDIHQKRGAGLRPAAVGSAGDDIKAVTTCGEGAVVSGALPARFDPILVEAFDSITEADVFGGAKMNAGVNKFVMMMAWGTLIAAAWRGSVLC